jgi:hypothetical protein
LGRVVTKVTTFASTIPLSIGSLVSGEPHRAFPYSVIEPVTLLLASTLMSSRTAFAPAGAVGLAALATAASVPHLPASPFAPCAANPNAAAAMRQETAIGIMYRILIVVLPIALNLADVYNTHRLSLTLCDPL